MLRGFAALERQRAQANIGQQQHQLGGQPGRGQRVESTDHRHAHPGRQQQGVVDMRGHTPEARIQRLWPGGQQQATGNKRQRGQHRAGEMQMFQGKVAHGWIIPPPTGVSH